MATLTIRNVSSEIVKNLKNFAERQGHSMEQEVRELLQNRFASRKAVLSRVRERWKKIPASPAVEIDAWIKKKRV